MHNVRNITEDLYWIGANDRRLALFENIHPIPEGVSYNSYMLLDKETVVFDTVDWSVTRQYIENIEYLLNGRELDYLVVHHMEPDHCASIEELAFRYPKMKIISSEKGFMFMRQFGYKSINGHQLIEAKEGDKFKFGKHEILFLEAPMVHWPEVLVSLDTTNGALFSADAFGSFKSLDGRLFNDEVNWDRDWLDEGRRYLTNIVGKYGPHIQHLLKKAAPVLDKIKFICPLHGVVWRNDFGYLIDKYDKWSRYEPEEKGVLIAYASMYGNTENAIEILAKKLAEKLRNGGCLGLIGDLGAGKTTFTKKICECYNVTENVKSPTFTYVIEYSSGDVPVYHFDVYRINDSEEIYEIGFEDYIGEDGSVVIIEWADKILEEMPEDAVFVEINHYSDVAREVSVYTVKNGEKVDFEIE